MIELRDDELTVDGLTSGWTMVQRKRGHRHSTDDLLTGWYAAECVRGARRILDLGAGIGSVGLLALWRSPGATLTSIEAQALSFALLERRRRYASAVWAQGGASGSPGQPLTVNRRR